MPLDDSVEEVCADYQGSFWFASSRQGVLQIYENYFSDLGTYWGLEEIVNTIQLYQDKIYVGCDSGLYCYQDKTQIEDALIKACKGERIRQIYLDQEKRLWVSTYQGGIKIMEADGRIHSLNSSNSGLTTNQIRCVWQKQDKDFLVGTEEGLFLVKENKSVEPFISDEILSSKRILDVKEDRDGTIYAATDGYGIYIIKNGKVETVYSKKQGLLSGVILKIVPSEKMNGVWIVTGEEISFLDQDGKLHRVEGIPVANSLDLQLTEKGEAIILAGNGFFRLKEEEMLKEQKLSYIYFNKQDGLPIDFTANAYNIIKNDILYMCGTAGAASVDLQKDVIKRSVRLYINSVTEDGKEIFLQDGKVRVSSSAHRLEIDVRLINFVHQNIYGKYILKDVDQEETIVQDCEAKEIGYTNLKGGQYQYRYKVYDADLDKCLAGLTIPFYKEYTLWEEPTVRILFALIICAFLILFVILIIRLREKQVKKQCQIEYLQEKEKEISKLAYRDLVTGVYNRNCFEVEKEKVDVTSIYALFSVSVNHMEYLKNRYSIRFQEDVLRNAADILQECSEEKLKIYRVSDNIFFFWMMEPLLMESYINKIKIQFEEVGKRVKAPLSFSVGAVYNNCVEKKTMDELINRCGKLRLLDEKHEEAKFFEGKLKNIEK